MLLPRVSIWSQKSKYGRLKLKQIYLNVYILRIISEEEYFDSISVTHLRGWYILLSCVYGLIVKNYMRS